MPRPRKVPKDYKLRPWLNVNLNDDHGEHNTVSDSDSNSDSDNRFYFKVQKYDDDYDKNDENESHPGQRIPICHGNFNFFGVSYCTVY